MQVRSRNFIFQCNLLPYNKNVIFRDGLKAATNTNTVVSCFCFFVLLSQILACCINIQHGKKMGKGRGEKSYGELYIFCIIFSQFSHRCRTFAVHSMQSNLGCICSLVYMTQNKILTVLGVKLTNTQYIKEESCCGNQSKCSPKLMEAGDTSIMTKKTTTAILAVSDSTPRLWTTL